eukprot:scaffold6410_cov106-Cylindrotheca_fusiformis.AAC.1
MENHHPSDKELEQCWRLTSLEKMARENRDQFGRHELALCSIIDVVDSLSAESKESIVRNAFSRRKLEPPEAKLFDSLRLMTQRKASKAREHIRKVREELFAGQFVKPLKDELVIDFFEQIDRLNNGERLQEQQFAAYDKHPANNQLFLTDEAAQILRHVFYAYNVSLSRMPGL